MLYMYTGKILNILLVYNKDTCTCIWWAASTFFKWSMRSKYTLTSWRRNVVKPKAAGACKTTYMFSNYKMLQIKFQRYFVGSFQNCSVKRCSRQPYQGLESHSGESRRRYPVHQAHFVRALLLFTEYICEMQ